MSKTNDYKPGNPEYDFWNDKNLYPDLRNDYDENHSSQTSQPSSLDDTEVGPGSVFVVIFGWIFILAPFALFFTWEDWIFQIIFWGGIALIVLVFVLWIYGAIEDERKKK